jgi:hypothetical protein
MVQEQAHFREEVQAADHLILSFTPLKKHDNYKARHKIT